MPSKSTLSCLDCDTTRILPEDPVALAAAATEFIEFHNRMQHWKFDLSPPVEAGESPDSEMATTTQTRPPVR
ncbi:MAG: hypothetical protein JO246_04225 [Frankiaceae bacterium]|nr:hypothetical protein [Frankiaceae bacterium]MBV9871415.1 hypothetical protein [Frankiaceae bacterium]